MIKQILYFDKISGRVRYFWINSRIILPPWRLLSVGTVIRFEIHDKYIKKYLFRKIYKIL